MNLKEGVEIVHSNRSKETRSKNYLPTLSNISYGYIIIAGSSTNASEI